MNYEKLTKAQLIAKILELENSNKANLEKSKNFDKIKLQNDILVNARKEDREKVVEAERTIALTQSKEQEMSQFYGQQIGHMKRTLDEQNETIVNLFDMMDNTINLQLHYYQKYKNIFISVEKKEE